VTMSMAEMVARDGAARDRSDGAQRWRVHLSGQESEAAVGLFGKFQKLFGSSMDFWDEVKR
jgi:hypothetical protein